MAVWGGLMAVWGGLDVVWGGLVEVWGGLGCFNGPVAGQLGLKSSRPLSQLGPGSTRHESTRPGVFSECLVTHTLYDIWF